MFRFKPNDDCVESDVRIWRRVSLSDHVKCQTIFHLLKGQLSHTQREQSIMIQHINHCKKCKTHAFLVFCRMMTMSDHRSTVAKEPDEIESLQTTLV